MQAFIPFETKSAILYDYYQLLIRLKGLYAHMRKCVRPSLVQS